MHWSCISELIAVNKESITLGETQEDEYQAQAEQRSPSAEASPPGATF